MAFFEMKFHSDALRINVSVNVILPEQAKTAIGIESKAENNYKTLFLLHGLSDDHSNWMRRTSIERYAAEYGIAVVMPAVGRSWYTDTVGGAKYLTFITEELPRACRGFFRGMSLKKEDTMIAGLSMGGYGAIKAALSAPDMFGACASLSGALDIAEFGTRMNMLEEWRPIFGYDMRSCDELKNSRHDIFALAKEFKESGKEFPPLYMWCGSEDFLLDHNRRFSSFISELGVNVKYEESDGNHSWKWWDLHIQDVLAFWLKQ